MKLAVINLDNVVVNSSKRFEMARMENGRIDWGIALDPANVKYDVIIPGAHKALQMIASAGYDVLFLTGRPEEMRLATYEWFAQNGIDPANVKMGMRPENDYSKAGDFKMRELDKIIKQLNPDEMLVIDDLVEDDLYKTRLLSYCQAHMLVHACATCYASLEAWKQARKIELLQRLTLDDLTYLSGLVFDKARDADNPIYRLLVEAYNCLLTD